MKLMEQYHEWGKLLLNENKKAAQTLQGVFQRESNASRTQIANALSLLAAEALFVGYVGVNHQQIMDTMDEMSMRVDNSAAQVFDSVNRVINNAEGGPQLRANALEACNQITDPDETTEKKCTFLRQNLIDEAISYKVNHPTY